MSRTKKGTKAPGFEFWSKRPGKLLSGKIGKQMTKARERMAKKSIVKKEMKEV